MDKLLHQLNERIDKLLSVSTGNDLIPTPASIPVPVSPLEQTYTSVMDSLLSSSGYYSEEDLSSSSIIDSHTKYYIHTLYQRIMQNIHKQDIVRFGTRIHECIVKKRILFHQLMELITTIMVTFCTNESSTTNHSNNNGEQSSSSSSSSSLPLLGLIYAVTQYSADQIPSMAIDILLRSVISAMIATNPQYAVPLSMIIASKFSILSHVSDNLFLSLSKDEQITVYLIIEALCRRKGHLAETTTLMQYLEFFHITTETYRSLPQFTTPSATTTEKNSTTSSLLLPKHVPHETTEGIVTDHHPLLITNDPLAFVIQRANQAVIHFIETFFTFYNTVNDKYLAINATFPSSSPTPNETSNSSLTSVNSSLTSTTVSSSSTDLTSTSNVISRQKAAMYIIRTALVFKVRCPPYPYCCCCTEVLNNQQSILSSDTASRLGYIPIELAWKILDITIERQTWDICRKLCLEVFPSLPKVDPPCHFCAKRQGYTISSPESTVHSHQHKLMIDIVSQLSALRYVAEASDELYHQRRVQREFTTLYQQIVDSTVSVSSSVATSFPSTNNGTSIPNNASSNSTTLASTTINTKQSSFVGVFPSSSSASKAVTSSLSQSFQNNPESVSNHGILGNGLSRPFDTLPLEQQKQLMDRPTPATILTQLELFKGHSKSTRTTSASITSVVAVGKNRPTYESIKERQNRSRDTMTTKSGENWREVTPALLPRQLEDRLFSDNNNNFIDPPDSSTEPAAPKWEASPFMVPRSLTDTMNSNPTVQSTTVSNVTTASASIVKSALAQQLKVGKDSSGIYMVDPPSEYQERSLRHILDVQRRNIPLALIYCGTDPGLQLWLLKQLIYRHQFNEAKGCLRALLVLNNIPLYETPVESMHADPKEESNTDSSSRQDTQTTVLTTTKLYGKINFKDIENAERNGTRTDQLDWMFQLSSPFTDTTPPSTSSLPPDGRQLTKEFLFQDDYNAHYTIPIKYDSQFWTPLFSNDENIHTIDMYAAGTPTVPPPNLTIVRTVTDLAIARKELERISCSTDSSVAEIEPFQILGIDTEWRPDGLYDHQIPSYGRTTNGIHHNFKDPVSPTVEDIRNSLSQLIISTDTISSSLHWPTSIIQLSTVQHTWIIDILSLVNHSLDKATNLQTFHDFGIFLRWLLFENSYFIKIGYRINGDLSRLIMSYPLLRKYIQQVKPVIDISDLLAVTSLYEQEQARNSLSESTPLYSNTTAHRRVHHILSSATTTVNNRSSNVSLSTLIQKYLGKPLDKRCQTSDWQIRPLSVMQLVYAATDAKAVACLAYTMMQKLPFYSLYTKYLQKYVVESDTPLPLPLPSTEIINENTYVDPERVSERRIMETLRSSLIWTFTAAVSNDALSNVSEPSINSEVPIPEFEYGFRSFFNTDENFHCLPGNGPFIPNPLHSLYTILDASVRSISTDTSVSLSKVPTLSNLPIMDTSNALGADDVALALTRAGLDPLVHHITVTSDATTAVYASESLGIPHSAVVKSLAFWNNTDPNNLQPLLFLISGDCVMDYTKASKVLKIPKKKLKLATPQECINVWGYSPGTFPPLGLRSRVPVYIDQLIQSRAVVTPLDTSGIHYIYAGGGSIRHSIRLTWDQLVRVTEGIVGDVATLSAKNTNKEVNGAKSSLDHSISSKDTDLVIVSPPLSATTINEQLPPPHKENGSKSIVEESSSIPVYELERPKFIVDTMLGRMLRWLRVIGIDAETVNGYEASQWYQQKFSNVSTPSSSTVPPPLPSSISSSFVLSPVSSFPPATVGPPVSLDHGLMIQWSNESNRIILTRDRKILNRKEPCVTYFLLANDTPSQFDEVVNRFGITVRPGDLMSRCAKCNGLGYERMSPTQLREAKLENPILYDTPDKVIDMVSEFWRCPRCLKVYWEGPKFEETREKYWTLFGNPKNYAQG